MDSRLTVLGSCGPWPEAGRACSGYLLEHADTRIVMDLGYGTVSRLFHHLGNSVGDGIDAVVITHEHPDHMHDLHALFRARWFGARGADPIPLFAPAGVIPRLAAVEDDDTETVGRVFAWRELPGTYELGPFTLRSWLLPHFVPNAGVRLESPGLTVAYTGDTGPSSHLVDLARAADLLIAEASDRGQRPATPPAPEGPHLHLSAREAGEVAAAAGARRLMLSHFWPGNDRKASVAEAAASYGGEVTAATEGLTLSLD